jgi:hypothetical protein
MWRAFGNRKALRQRVALDVIAGGADPRIDRKSSRSGFACRETGLHHKRLAISVLTE